MDDSSQIIIPPSFTALYVPPGKTRLTETHAHIAQRYELCEDMATMLSGTAAEQQFKTGCDTTELLQSMASTLAAPGGLLQPNEAHWVVCRLAELLHWDMPPPDAVP